MSRARAFICLGGDMRRPSIINLSSAASAYRIIGILRGMAVKRAAIMRISANRAQRGSIGRLTREI